MTIWPKNYVIFCSWRGGGAAVPLYPPTLTPMGTLITTWNPDPLSGPSPQRVVYKCWVTIAALDEVPLR